MSTRSTRSYFASIVPFVRLHHVCSLGILLFLLCGYGQATAVAQVQIAPAIAVIAGNGTVGFSGQKGPATSAELGNLGGIALDSAGNLYIADEVNSVVWKVSAATNVITVVAGNGTSGFSGQNGPATSAELGSPAGIAFDSAGNLYIADAGDSVIWKLSAATGLITVVAGNGNFAYTGDGGPATSAALAGPSGLALDSAGDIYIADSSNNVVRFVSAATGTITTIVGNGMGGFSGDGGPATGAELNLPTDVVLDSAGDLYITDTFNGSVRFVSAATGTITTVAGTGVQGSNGINGVGGPATSAKLAAPGSVVLDSANNLYIADDADQVIWEVSAATGTITVFAGNGMQGFGGNGGPPASAEFNLPSSVAFNKAGNLFIADSNNAVVWEISSTIQPFPATAVGSSSAAQNVFLQLNAAQTITSITAAASQGGKQEYVAGKITGCVVDGKTSNPAGTVCAIPLTFQPAYTGNRGVTLQAVTDTGTFAFGLNGVGTGPQVALLPGTIVTAAGGGKGALSLPVGTTVDSAGDIFIADALGNVVWKVSAATATIATVAGNGTGGFSGDGGAATGAELNNPSSVAVDSTGNLYIVDATNQRVRMVSAATGVITTVAGNGTEGFSGDGGAATGAELNNPDGIAVDSAGDIYIADSGNNRIRVVSASAGTITTVAGNGMIGFSGDGGAATSAELHSPNGVTLDGAGNLYIADSGNNRIRMVSAGTISTIAGTGTAGFSGDGGAATSAELDNPDTVAVDAAGNLYIADTLNNRIRMVSAATGTIVTAAGNGTIGLSGDGGAATGAELHTPISVALDSVGNLYVADSLNFVVREVEVTMPPAVTFPTPTAVGTTDSTDGPQAITIANIGNATLNFEAPQSVATGFTLDSSGTCPSGSSATLAQGANCTVAVDFAPTVTGAVTGSVVVTDNALNAVAPGFATQSIALSGMGTMAAAPTVPTLTFASIPNQVEGAAPFAVSATSASTGAVTYAVTSGPATIAGNMVTVTGTGTVVLTANQAAAGNFTAATATASFMVVAPFTLTTANGTMSVAAGAAASYSLTLTPPMGITLNDPITLAATGLPAGATATFSPAGSIMLGSAAATVTLSIQTASATTAHNEKPVMGNRPGAIALGFLLLPLLGIKAARRRLRQSLPLALLVVGLSFGAMLGIDGCSGGSSAPPPPVPQTSTVVVTATDTTTNVQSSTSLTLTVQ